MAIEPLSAVVTMTLTLPSESVMGTVMGFPVGFHTRPIVRPPRIGAVSGKTVSGTPSSSW